MSDEAAASALEGVYPDHVYQIQKYADCTQACSHLDLEAGMAGLSSYSICISCVGL